MQIFRKILPKLLCFFNKMKFYLWLAVVNIMLKLQNKQFSDVTLFGEIYSTLNFLSNGVLYEYFFSFKFFYNFFLSSLVLSTKILKNFELNNLQIYP